jgi:hypothetical protein
MTGLRSSVPSCAEHERLAFELLALRTRTVASVGCAASLGRNRPEWDRRRYRGWRITNRSTAAGIETLFVAKGNQG